MQKELLDTTENKLSESIDIKQLVLITNSIIQIDVDLSIQYIDSRVASFTGESEELEAELKKWYKDFAARRLDLTRPVNESLKQVIADEKKIGDYLDKIFADNKAKREAVEAERKKAKYAEVMTTMADMLNSVDLPPEYIAKVVFREEYYNKTMVNKKLADSIQAQIDDQVKMYNGWKAEQELKQQKIKNRELLIENYNHKYELDAKYSQMPVEMYSDEQVIDLFERNHQKQEAERLAKIEKENQDAQKAQEQAAAEAQKVSFAQDAVVAKHSDDNDKAKPAQPEAAQATTSLLADAAQEIHQEASAQSVLEREFKITLKADSTKNCVDAMDAVEKRLDEMSVNLAKYNVTMSYASN